MTKNSGKWILLILIAIFYSDFLYSQKLVEAIAGNVGNEVIYLSEIEGGVAQQLLSGDRTPANTLRCMIFEEQLITKLFLDQARIDSIEVPVENIDNNLNITLNRYIAQAGSEKALEEYFKKSMIEIRRDIRKAMLNQQIVGEVQSTIADKISITPSEVKKYYSGISTDSLPKIPAMVELRIIQLDPPENEQNKADARQKLLDLRSRILAGESFSILSVLYSEDIESAKKGGEIGYSARGDLDKAYSDAAFSLSKNAVSRIVESRYGFHIIQLIDRMGDMVNTRHILIRPKVKPEQALKAITKLDSIADFIRRDSMTFERAAMRFSTHKDSRINGGRLVKNDPDSRITWFTLEELDKETYVRVRDLKIGEISEPFRTTDENGNTVFRIVKLDSQTPAHVADLKTDYQILYNQAMFQKRSKYYQQWIDKKIGVTYIRISEEFKSCPFKNKGWMK